MEIDQGLLHLAALSGGMVAIGLGAIGHAFGIGVAARHVAQIVARQPSAEKKLEKVFFVTQVVSETVIVLPLFIGFVMFFKKYPVPENIGLMHPVALVAAGICIGLGTMGPGIRGGIINANACDGVAVNPDSEPFVLRTLIVGQIVSQAASLSAFAISMCLIFAI